MRPRRRILRIKGNGKRQREREKERERGGGGGAGEKSNHCISFTHLFQFDEVDAAFLQPGGCLTSVLFFKPLKAQREKARDEEPCARFSEDSVLT